MRRIATPPTAAPARSRPHRPGGRGAATTIKSLRRIAREGGPAAGSADRTPERPAGHATRAVGGVSGAVTTDEQCATPRPAPAGIAGPGGRTRATSWIDEDS